MTELEIFEKNLLSKGITMSLDQEKRSDGERLENYVFEKDGAQTKVIEKLVTRVTGQSNIFVSKGKYYEMPLLTDRKFYEQFAFIILGTLEHRISCQDTH